MLLTIRRKVFIEGMLLLMLGLVGIAESVLLLSSKNPRFHQDSLGPGGYMIIVGFLLAVVGLIHIISGRRENSIMEKQVKYGERLQVLRIITILAVYSLLIGITGYLLATLVFFFLILRVLGFRSWITTLILTVVFSMSAYVIFVRLLGMIFPEGIIFA